MGGESPPCLYGGGEGVLLESQPMTLSYNMKSLWAIFSAGINKQSSIGFWVNEIIIQIRSVVFVYTITKYHRSVYRKL